MKENGSGVTPVATAAISELLGRIPFLKDLDPATRDHMASRIHERKFAKGAIVFSEGEPCPGFWIVRSGSINILKVSQDGRIQILETCQPGEICALVSALDGGPYPATTEAREPSTLYFVPREELMSALERAPRVAASVAATYAARLRKLTTKLAAVSLQDVRARVAGYILDEAAARGSVGADGILEVTLMGHQHEIARRLGTAREVLARTLRAIEVEGLIERHRDHVRILELAALRSAAGR